MSTARLRAALSPLRSSSRLPSPPSCLPPRLPPPALTGDLLLELLNVGDQLLARRLEEQVPVGEPAGVAEADELKELGEEGDVVERADDGGRQPDGKQRADRVDDDRGLVLDLVPLRRGGGGGRGGVRRGSESGGSQPMGRRHRGGSRCRQAQVTDNPLPSKAAIFMCGGRRAHSTQPPETGNGSRACPLMHDRGSSPCPPRIAHLLGQVLDQGIGIDALGGLRPHHKLLVGLGHLRCTNTSISPRTALPPRDPAFKTSIAARTSCLWAIWVPTKLLRTEVARWTWMPARQRAALLQVMLAIVEV